MADIIDNARDKTKLLKEFLRSAQVINAELQAPDDENQIEVIAAEVEKRDGYISEINLINKLIETSNITDENQKSELEEETRLWFRLFQEIDGIEKKNNALINGLESEYMGKVKSAKDSIRAIDAYSKLMGEGSALSGSIDKRK